MRLTMLTRLLLSGVLALLLWPGQGWGAVPIFDNATNAQCSSCVTKTTPAFAIGGSNRVAILHLSSTTNSISAITASCGGVSGTLVSGSDTTTGAASRIMTFVVVAPPVGSQTCTASWTTSSADFRMGVITLTGVDQAAPTDNGTFVIRASAASAPITITSTATGLTVSGTLRGGGAPANSTDQTLRWANGNVASGDTGPGTGTTTHTWSGPTATWAITGVNVRAGGGDPDACSGSSPTWTANATQASIANCISGATTGDTINILAGTAVFTSQVVISGKALTLIGAGIGSTIIQNNTSAPALLITASATNFVDVSHITFQESAASTNGIVQIQGTIFEVAFRFHHNAVNHNTTGARGIRVDSVYGVIDHVTFTVGTASVQSISVFGGSDGGYEPWSQALGLGTNQAVYIEENTLTRTNLAGEDAIDMAAGARAVIRYNTFVNAHAGFHGTDSGDRRSPVSVEVYNNVFRNTTTASYEAGRMRGGTGVWYSNTWSNTSSGSWSNINLLNYRACDGNTGQGWKQCNGTQYVVGSATLSSTAAHRCCDISTNPVPGMGGCAAWPTVDWINNYGFDATNPDTLPLGVHGAGNNTLFFDGAGTGGYPCRDQVGRAPGQVLEPVYAWSNTGGPVLAGYDAWANNCGGFGLANYILSGRDFINNGSTPKPGYTAYTYPHPLNVPDGGGAPPEPPPGSRFPAAARTLAGPRMAR